MLANWRYLYFSKLQLTVQNVNARVIPTTLSCSLMTVASH